jgi:hypothetical protein
MSVTRQSTGAIIVLLIALHWSLNYPLLSTNNSRTSLTFGADDKLNSTDSEHTQKELPSSTAECTENKIKISQFEKSDDELMEINQDARHSWKIKLLLQWMHLSLFAHPVAAERRARTQ